MVNYNPMIGQMMNNSLGSLLSSLTLLFGSLIMMYVTNALMATAAVLASLLGFAIMILIMVRSQKYFSAQQNILGVINGHIEETYAGHLVVKAYNGEADRWTNIFCYRPGRFLRRAIQQPV